MEASEKPQLSLDSATSDGIVRVLGDRLVIEGLTISDERAARVVRERAEASQRPADTVTKAVEIGARVLDSEETAANVDYVRAELGRSLGVVSQELTQQADAAIEGLTEKIASSFGPERADSVQAQIKEIVAAEAREQRETLIGTLTAEDGSNPLVAIQARLGKAMLDAEERHRREVELLRESHSKEARAMHGQVSELRKEVARMLEREDADERVAEAEEAGTRKGFTFEDRVDAAIERIAAARGIAPPTRGARAPRAVAERATRSSSWERPTDRPRAGSSSSPRTGGFPRTTPGASSTRRWLRVPLPSRCSSSPARTAFRRGASRSRSTRATS